MTIRSLAGEQPPYRAFLRIASLLALVSVVISITGCIILGRVPPTNLVYPQTTITATVGQVIATDTPTITGVATSYTVSPALPAGLSLSASNGAISGTPTAVAAQATYTVTAANNFGSAVATVQIVVNAAVAPPSNLVYPQTSITATVGQAIATETPTVTGTVTSYSVSPALPAGLSFSASTGAISGTPTAVAAQATYTVTASNSSGSTTAAVQIAVKLAPPANLLYPQTTITATVGQAIATDTPTVTGTVTGYTVSPALPAGLSLNASTGVISGTPTAVTAQATYTVTAANSSGSTTAVVQIAVNPGPPANLVYPQTSITAAVGQVITTDTPSVTGTVTGYTVSPALPAGLSLNATTGSISGTPTAVTAQATYVVTATNSIGSTTASLTITVTSFSVYSLLDLGHTNSIAALRVQTSRLFSEDITGHWALWNYGTTTELASGNASTTTNTTSPYPSDMAGSILAVGIANAVEVRSTADGSLITTLTGPSLDRTPVDTTAWWKLATDGSYIASGYVSGLFVWSTTDGHLLFTHAGDYSIARAFASPGQLQIAQGPAGTNVIETDSIPAGTSAIGPAFTGAFNMWFTDGSHFLTNGPNLSPPSTPTLYDVYTYTASSVQVGMVALNSQRGLNGYGNWFWMPTDTSLIIYPVGDTTPAATYPLVSISNVVPSGSTLGLLPYGPAAASIVDLSGSTLTRTDVTLPVSYNNVFAATSPTQWVVGNLTGVVLDAPSVATTPRFFGYGVAYSMAGAPGRAVVATAVGKILTFDPGSKALINTINFPSSKIALSSDGTVLAAAASTTDSQYEPDRTLNIYSLPSGALTNSFPYTYNDATRIPFLFDFTLSGSGTALGQLLGTYNGQYYDYTREVTPPSGSPVIWSDHPPSGPYSANTPIFLSPDGTLIATSAGDYSTATTSIYKNGVFVAAVKGFVAGWIDNNRVLVNTFQLGSYNYTGSIIYDATGVQLASLPNLPELVPLGLPAIHGFITVSPDTIYSPADYSIYSLTTGAAVWTESLPHGLTPTYPNIGPSTISGNYLVFVSGTRILVDVP